MVKSFAVMIRLWNFNIMSILEMHTCLQIPNLLVILDDLCVEFTLHASLGDALNCMQWAAMRVPSPSGTNVHSYLLELFKLSLFLLFDFFNTHNDTQALNLDVSHKTQPKHKNLAFNKRSFVHVKLSQKSKNRSMETSLFCLHAICAVRLQCWQIYECQVSAAKTHHDAGSDFA